MAEPRDGWKSRDSRHRILNFSDKILTDRENAARSRRRVAEGVGEGWRIVASNTEVSDFVRDYRNPGKRPSVSRGTSSKRLHSTGNRWVHSDR